MAEIYADLIEKGLKTLEEVPDILRQRVLEMLNHEA